MRYPEAPPPRVDGLLGVEPLPFDHGPEQHEYGDGNLWVARAFVMMVIGGGLFSGFYLVRELVRWLAR